MKSKITKVLKHEILNNICSMMDEKRRENAGKLPYGCMTQILKDSLPIAPWLTRDKVDGFYRTVWSKSKTAKSKGKHAEEGRCNTGGRPVGSTISKRKICELSIISAKNEIAVKFSNEKSQVPEGERLKRGRLREIVEEVKSNRNLPPNLLQYNKGLCNQIRTRTLRNKLITRDTRGAVSPLAEYEESFVKVIIQMARIRQCPVIL